MKMAKETWIQGQCQEVEACPRKNNSKKAYQLVKDLATEKQGKSTTIQRRRGSASKRRIKSLTGGQSTAQTFSTMRLMGDPTVLDCPQIPDEEHHRILREEVEAAVKALKMGKPAGVDNIPAELVQEGGEAMIDILTSVCNKIWKTGKWPTNWTQSLVTTLPKKGNCSCARTTEPSTLSAILVRSSWKSSLTSTPATSTRDHYRRASMFQILCKKYLPHQQNLYRVFIDFKKAFDRVWHEALWATWGNTTSMPASYKPLNICMTRPRVQSCLMAAQENGSELQ